MAITYRDVDDALLAAMAQEIVAEADPEAIVLFGSYAKGTDQPGSDVDLLVVMSDTEEVRRHRRQITARLYRRLAPIAAPKDILVFTRDEVEHWRNVPGHIVATSLNEGKRLYERP